MRAAVTDVGAGERDDGGGSRLVLVVDDDDLVRRVVRAVLEVDDLEVVEATDGEAALSLATEAHPAVVLLNLALPGIDGVEVCRRLDHRSVKVVVLTAGDAPDLERECREAGAVAFVTKPFASGELVDLVEALLAV